jgi:hypothetical protein
MITNKMMADSLRIAKSFINRKSGNMQDNAIKLLRRKNGFTIKYSSTDAYYITFVEEGTSKQDAQKFIARTYIELSNYFANVGNGNQGQNYGANDEAKNRLNMELYRENPDYRRLVHRDSIFQHYQTEGTNDLYRRRGE